MEAPLAGRPYLPVHSVLVAPLVLLVLLTGLPAQTAAQTPRRPRKVVNIKAGLGYYGRHSPDSPHICTKAHRAVGEFGLETAFFPFTAAFDFYTNVALEVYAGAYWPAVPIGDGWLTLHGGFFWRTTMREHATDDTLLCQGPTATRMPDAYGLGATVEYLLYDGYLGFYIESRQSIIDPIQTSVTAGITVSPLLVLLYRNR